MVRSRDGNGRTEIESDHVYGLAMEKAAELLQADLFAGKFFEGELMETIPKMGEALFTSYPDELKGHRGGCIGEERDVRVAIFRNRRENSSPGKSNPEEAIALRDSGDGHMSLGWQMERVGCPQG